MEIELIIAGIGIIATINSLSLALIDSYSKQLAELLDSMQNLGIPGPKPDIRVAYRTGRYGLNIFVGSSILFCMPALSYLFLIIVPKILYWQDLDVASLTGFNAKMLLLSMHETAVYLFFATAVGLSLTLVYHVNRLHRYLWNHQGPPLIIKSMLDSLSSARGARTER